MTVVVLSPIAFSNWPSLYRRPKSLWHLLTIYCRHHFFVHLRHFVTHVLPQVYKFTWFCRVSYTDWTRKRNLLKSSRNESDYLTLLDYCFYLLFNSSSLHILNYIFFTVQYISSYIYICVCCACVCEWVFCVCVCETTFVDVYVCTSSSGNC